MAKLAGTRGKSTGVKYRRDKREEHARRAEEESVDSKVLQVTEFITVSELASLMNVEPTAIIKVCMGLGVFVSINQRIDAEIIELVAGEFDYEVQFTTITEQYRDWETDRKSTRLNSSHSGESRMPSSA